LENKSQLLARFFHPSPKVYNAFMKFISLFGVKFMESVSVLYNKIERLNTTQTTRTQIDPVLRAQLVEHVREDVTLLGELLERDLSGWLT
jgi:hypothetical protein